MGDVAELVGAMRGIGGARVGAVLVRAEKAL